MGRVFRVMGVGLFLYLELGSTQACGWVDWDDTGPEMLGNEQSEIYVVMDGGTCGRESELPATAGCLLRDRARGWTRVVHDQGCGKIGNVIETTVGLIYLWI